MLFFNYFRKSAHRFHEKYFLRVLFVPVFLLLYYTWIDSIYLQVYNIFITQKARRYIINPGNIGQLIRRLRTEKKLTQKQLAEKINVSDKAVSKWETGNGIPDIAILAELAELFQTDMQTLLDGRIHENESENGNMKKIKFYVCKECGNIITSTSETGVTCCGKKLTALEMKEASDGEKLNAEYDGGEWYVTTDHPMTKEHYISFVAYLNDSTAVIFRQYPEWQVNLHIPFATSGRLVWYCNRCGLMYQNLRRKK